MTPRTPTANDTSRCVISPRSCECVSIVFIVTTIFGALLWFRDAAFESYDREWVRKMGGYLGHKGEVPAGRFNAGQKMFYWYSGIAGAIMSRLLEEVERA